MCGLAGIVHRTDHQTPPARETLERMIRAIRYRGPDEYGIYRDQHAGLVHARLSLVDLATGQQPLSNEDGSLWIALNGEIFNYVELRQTLLQRGHTFRTKSDTETALHAYEEWGTSCFTRFNGQWALAIWNATDRTLVLSRDRIGVRPLFIHETPDTLRFASEVKAIFADPAVPRTINPHGLAQTFTYWASIAPTSVFGGIEELRPGCVRTYFRNGSQTNEQYWSLSYPHRGNETQFASFGEAVEGLQERLREATRLRMVRADVPVGSYLSGGLDSSLIAWMGRQAKEGDFRTFSLRFEDAEFDETPYQRAMAATIDSSHTEIVVTRPDIAQVFPDVVYHAERPILRTAPAPLFLLSRSVREAGIKAVLTGEGADEMLVGYDLFREAKIREFWSRNPASTIRPRLFERLYPYLARAPQKTGNLALDFWRRGLDRAGKPGFSHDPRWSTTSALQRFFSTDMKERLRESPAPDVLHTLPPEFSTWDPIAQAQYLEVTTLLSGYLMSSQGDRMLMAHSVEGRFPFLDVDVIEFCNALPMEYKLCGLKEKFILKKAAGGHVPQEIIDRPKQPYRAPDAVSFLGNDAPGYVSAMLDPSNVKNAGIFDPVAVKGLHDKCLQRAGTRGKSDTFSNSDNMAFVGILSAQLMYEHCIIQGEGKGASGPPVPFWTDIDRSEASGQTNSGTENA